MEWKIENGKGIDDDDVCVCVCVLLLRTFSSSISVYPTRFFILFFSVFVLCITIRFLHATLISTLNVFKPIFSSLALSPRQSSPGQVIYGYALRLQRILKIISILVLI